MYKLEGLDFGMSPTSSFVDHNKNSMTFIDYYKTKHNIQIKTSDQPLLLYKDRKTNKEIYLIPELCGMTGLNARQRNDFNTMKQLATITKPEPSKRLLECQDLIVAIEKNEKVNEYLKKWNISIEKDPMKLEGIRLDPGNFVMGSEGNRRIEIALKNSGDLDRQIQRKMFKQPNVERWAIFTSKRDEESCHKFADCISECLQTFDFKMRQPRIFTIESNSFNEWKRRLENELNESVQAVVLILSGPKKAAPLYNDLKHLLLTKIPIPSQVVLTKTLQGKGLRSICNKILIQICAKIGGIPWFFFFNFYFSYFNFLFIFLFHLILFFKIFFFLNKILLKEIIGILTLINIKTKFLLKKFK